MTNLICKIFGHKWQIDDPIYLQLDKIPCSCKRCLATKTIDNLHELDNQR